MASAGKAGGIFAGAMVGIEAGRQVFKEIEPGLSGTFQDHAGMVEDSLAAAGGFGCAVAGYMLAARKPEQAVLIAAATLAAGKLSKTVVPFTGDSPPAHDHTLVASSEDSAGVHPHGHADPHHDLHAHVVHDHDHGASGAHHDLGADDGSASGLITLA
jgi:hypothetical protein